MRSGLPLLLLSDGKPTDYGHYEGACGMADVHKALREAQRAHVLPFALAIDAQARSYLPAMFGAGSYEILPDPGPLTEALLRLFSRLLRWRPQGARGAAPGGSSDYLRPKRRWLSPRLTGFARPKARRL